MARRANNSGTVTSYTTSSGRVLWRLAYWVELENGERARKFKRGFESEQDAHAALEDIRVDMRRGSHVEEIRDRLDDYAAEYLATIRVRPTTLAGYRKHYRVHVQGSTLGKLPISAITKDHLNRFYRGLERSGRKDKGHEGEPLGLATVRHVHVLLSQILSHALDDGKIKTNPAKKASPPRKVDAAPPEMHVWTAGESKQFLDWSRESGDYLYLAWRTLLATGLRRGEILALRWRDVDFTAGTIVVRRAMQYVKEAGTAPVTTFGPPKNGKPRNVDIDPQLVTELRVRRDGIRSVAPEHAAADSLVFSNRYGRPHNPVQFSRQWRERVAKAQETLPDLPTIKLHEGRHTHATTLLSAGVNVRVVSERLGHTSAAVTLTIYAHAIKSLQRAAADMMGDLFA
ncbi:tyrosine-type recombinase/integrase [Rathayibacter sp. AY1B4]|uniref:tyrosine-type recombinase/integrase n=2 Tax=unclassified Rathayibacter TaxID=2609250 RepID=UPI0035BE55BD